MRIFNTALDHAFRIAYPENATIPLRDFRQLHIEEGLARLAEELILFGKVSLQIAGENGALPLLVHHLGVKEVERLLDNQVIEFVLNSTMLIIPVQTYHLQPPLIRAIRNDAIYNEADASLESGFRRADMSTKVSEVQRQNLIRKARDLYKTPDHEAGSKAVEMALEAYEKGFFIEFGLEPKNWKDITLQERQTLSECGEDLFEFGIITKYQLGTLNKRHAKGLLDKTFRLAQQATEIQGGFGEIASFERIPNIHSLVIDERLSFRDAVELSQSKAGENFQQWIESATTDPEESKDVTKAYLDAIESKGSFFGKPYGKIIKALGAAGLTNLIVLESGAKGAIARLAGPALSFLMDTFKDSLFRKWNPRIYFNKLRSTIDSKD